MVIICTDCQLQMRPSKTGVPVEAISTFGSYQLLSGDAYMCPKCHKFVVAGVGQTAIAEHYEASYRRTVENLTTRAGYSTRFWVNQEEKRKYEETQCQAS